MAPATDLYSSQPWMQRLHPADPNRTVSIAVKEFIRSIRHAVLVLSHSVTGLSAHAGTASTFVGGELGFVDQPVASTLTREQVRQDFVAFRRNPILNDGATLFVGGEQGYVDQPASRTTREAVRQDLPDRHPALAVPVEAP